MILKKHLSNLELAKENKELRAEIEAFESGEVKPKHQKKLEPKKEEKKKHHRGKGVDDDEKDQTRANGG